MEQSLLSTQRKIMAKIGGVCNAIAESNRLVAQSTQVQKQTVTVQKESARSLESQMDKLNAQTERQRYVIAELNKQKTVLVEKNKRLIEQKASVEIELANERQSKRRALDSKDRYKEKLAASEATNKELASDLARERAVADCLRGLIERSSGRS